MTQADEGVEGVAQTPTQATSGGGVGVAEWTHGAVRDQFSEYLDGSLGQIEAERLEGHLANCADCAAYLATLRSTVDLLSQLPTTTYPPGAKAAILDQVRSGQ